MHTHFTVRLPNVQGDASKPTNAAASDPTHDDLSALLPEYASDGAQVVPLRVGSDATEAELRSSWAALHGLPLKVLVRRHRYVLAFALTDCNWAGPQTQDLGLLSEPHICPTPISSLVRCIEPYCGKLSCRDARCLSSF